MASKTNQSKGENLECENRIIQDSKLSKGDLLAHHPLYIDPGTTKSLSSEDDDDDSGSDNSESEYEPRKSSRNSLKQQTPVAAKASGGGRIGKHKGANVAVEAPPASSGSARISNKKKVAPVPATITTATCNGLNGDNKCAEPGAGKEKAARPRIAGKKCQKPRTGEKRASKPELHGSKKVRLIDTDTSLDTTTIITNIVDTVPDLFEEADNDLVYRRTKNNEKNRSFTDIFHPERLDHYIITDGLDALDEEKQLDLANKRSQFKVKQLEQYIESINEHARLVSEHARCIIDIYKEQ